MKDTRICDNCGAEHPISKMFEVEGDWLCEDCADRYTTVNLTNSDTVEIRMFRGTLKLNTLKATLQMVNHFVEVAVSMSDYQMQDMSWFDFLDEIKEPELIQYLKERRLYVNEPVTTSEEE